MLPQMRKADVACVTQHASCGTKLQRMSTSAVQLALQEVVRC